MVIPHHCRVGAPLMKKSCDLLHFFTQHLRLVGKTWGCKARETAGFIVKLKRLCLLVVELQVKLIS